MKRRQLLIGTVAAGVTAAVSACGTAGAPTRPLALVYRGPAACSGCAEAVAALLRNCPTGFRTRFCGPAESLRLTADALAGAVVYAQPGGGTLESAWPRVRRYAGLISDFVHGGGRYLGFCLGGYLAGATPGFGLLPGDAGRYVGTDGAGVHTLADTIVSVRWRGRIRQMYFQDGPAFRLEAGASATVLAVYDNGLPAAVVAGFGSGSVGVVGPHPEADGSWFAESRLSDPGGPAFDLGYDLVETTVHGALP